MCVFVCLCVCESWVALRRKLKEGGGEGARGTGLESQGISPPASLCLSVRCREREMAKAGERRQGNEKVQWCVCVCVHVFVYGPCLSAVWVGWKEGLCLPRHTHFLLHLEKPATDTLKE